MLEVLDVLEVLEGTAFPSSTSSTLSTSSTFALPLLDYQKPDRPLLSVAEPVIDERELPGNVADELEHHPSAGRNGKGLHAANA